MKKYLQERYNLSDEGFTGVKKAIISSAVSNLIFMVPLLISFLRQVQYTSPQAINDSVITVFGNISLQN